MRSLSSLAAWPSPVRPRQRPLLCAMWARRGARCFLPLPRRVCADPLLCANGGVISGAQRYAPTLRPLPPLMSKRTTSAGSAAAAVSLSRAPICVTGASFAPHQGTGTWARGIIPCPLPFEQGPGGAWRGRQDGSGHAAGVAGTPPSIRVRACHRVLPSPPFAQPVCVQWGSAEPEPCELEGTEGKRMPLPHCM